LTSSTSCFNLMTLLEANYTQSIQIYRTANSCTSAYSTSQEKPLPRLYDCKGLQKGWHAKSTAVSVAFHSFMPSKVMSPGTRFECRPTYRLSWLNGFVFFLSPSRWVLKRRNCRITERVELYLTFQRDRWDNQDCRWQSAICTELRRKELWSDFLRKIPISMRCVRRNIKKFSKYSATEFEPTDKKVPFL
jgi:hypothetical protein